MTQNFSMQHYVFKLHSHRIRRANWNLQLTVNQARESNELIMISESQMIRFIEELNGVENLALRVKEIRAHIRSLNSCGHPAKVSPKIQALYAELDDCQFLKDYVCVVMDSNKEYQKLYQNGFELNNTRYRRLLGTVGGVKSNTIVFVNETLLPKLKRKIDNGRNPQKEFTPAKLEAYKALACSASTPVSWPEGILVVQDCVTHFTADVIELNDDGLKQPSMKHVKNKEIELIDSDGYGLAMPHLMERWGRELGKNYLLPGCIIRNSFCKGCVFPIDFQAFAHQHNVTTITDVWGNAHPIDKIELVLTTSMLKLWDSYASIEDYVKNCKENHYTFAITKASEKNLEDVHSLNYQFLQSYDFTDEEIDELIAPTVNEIRDVLYGDYRKAILYAKGHGLNEKNVTRLDTSPITAMMIEPELYHDPYLQNQIYGMIEKRIDEAKIGVLNVPANYSLVSGDPYSLCQSMCGLPVTGLLKAGEVYSKYWIEKGVDKIASFRAPMSAHNNIRLLNVVHNDIMDEFYQYITTPTIFNSWDTCADAMNGLDKDGDTVFNTSLPLLVEHTEELPAIVCVQRKASKRVPTDDDLMKSNIDSFGNAIGKITNRITSMFEVRSRYERGSREYRILDYRIKCGQLYQQNEIDKAKGIVASQMPEAWYRWIHDETENGTTNWMNKKLVADKKPYFMQYIYPSERKHFKEYVQNNNAKSLMLFRTTLSELQAKPDKTPEENAFLQYYERDLPLGTAPCTMNRICWKIEQIFGNVKKQYTGKFDYTILKSNAKYSSRIYYDIKKLYEQYKSEMADYMQYARSERIKSEEQQIQKYLFKEKFMRKCYERCPNKYALCDIVLKLCYSHSNVSKQFAWDICGDVIIENLLKKNDYTFSYPTLDENGDIEYGGQRFRMTTIKLEPEC